MCDGLATVSLNVSREVTHPRDPRVPNQGYEHLGPQTVKNIAEPVSVYRVLLDPSAAGTVIGEKKPSVRWQDVVVGALLRVSSRSRRRRGLAATIALNDAWG